MSISVRAIISGKVQGVWYRQSTLEKAQALGLAGWVRNRSNGDVEALFEGDAIAVEEALKWCEVGPPLAKVSKVERYDEEPTGIKSPFEIRHTT
ncbi:MAG: acylphosphatase [Deltaproteobacteria bacterium]|nr:MAG: acylphosphatase [Deltaproteobacteria bacterium]